MFYLYRFGNIEVYFVNRIWHSIFEENVIYLQIFCIIFYLLCPVSYANNYDENGVEEGLSDKWKARIWVRVFLCLVRTHRTY